MANERLEQIRRSHRSARPKPDNPAWFHTHNDLTVALAEIDRLNQELIEARKERWFGEAPLAPNHGVYNCPRCGAPTIPDDDHKCEDLKFFAAMKEEPMSNTSDIPRRADVLRYTAAEKSILDAMYAVEAMGADVKLTEAVVLLGKAKDAVADFVDANAG